MCWPEWSGSALPDHSYFYSSFPEFSVIKKQPTIAWMTGASLGTKNRVANT